MKVVLCAAEVVPFAKVGGLADVMGSLPKALADIQDNPHVEPMVVMPLYGMIDPEQWQLQKTNIHLAVTLDGKPYPVNVWHGHLPGSTVSVYFMDNHELFGSRQSVYPYGQPELEIQSFRLLGKSLFALLKEIRLSPDILHLHDWHTAPIAVELAELRKHDPQFANTRSVFTIHNLAYQGVFGDTNWLREGLIHADALTTVSPTYAKEIQTPQFGEGLQDLLVRRSNDLSGILNGIDLELLNPKTDKFISRQFSVDSFSEGKTACKADLQKEMGLPVDPNVPVIGFVSRLVDQKGLDIMLPAIHQLNEQLGQGRFQWAILGTGDPRYEDQFKALNEQYPYIRTMIGFNLALAQKIYAGSDMFAMPSAFEPCGLGQMIALRYGSVPVVRAVGGLADTVFDVRHQADGNGFCFHDYTPAAFTDTLRAAIAQYQNQAEWAKLVKRGMQGDFSWDQSARTYRDLYQKLHTALPTL